MKRDTVTVKEVKELISKLGSVLGLVEEDQALTFKIFVKDYKMDIVEASMLAQYITYNENYIEDSAQGRLETIMPRFPYRTEEDVKDKLMKIQSILVAVALVWLSKLNSKEIIMKWIFDGAQELIVENSIPNGIQRLEAVLDYLGSN